MENRNRSAQRFISNTAASIAPPVSEHISTTYSNLRGRRGGARGGEMAFATMNASPPRKNARSQSVPPKGKSARSQSVPPGKGTPPTAKVRTSDARQCTISSTILSLILSIIPSLVYYKKHTSNLLTLKSESGILWSS